MSTVVIKIVGEGATANWPKHDFFLQMAGRPFFLKLLPAVAHSRQTSNGKVVKQSTTKIKVATF